MKTSKTFLLVVDFDSLGCHFGLQWLNDHIENYVINSQTFEGFYSFVLPKNNKIRLILLDMIASLSLFMDVYNEAAQNSSLIRDIAFSLRNC